MKVKPVKLCDFCGKDVSHKKNRGYKKSFCNKECSNKYVAAAREKYVETVECKTCNEKFRKRTCDIERTNNNNFCSRSCAAIYNNSETPKRKKEIFFCIECKQPTQKQQRMFCETCNKLRNEKIKSTTIEQIRERECIKGKHPSWMNPIVSGYNRTWNRALTKQPCQYCGYSIHVELCHIIPVSKFPKEAVLSEVNSPDNLLVLCSNHHWEFDHGHLSLEQIPKRKEQIEQESQ